MPPGSAIAAKKDLSLGFLHQQEDQLYGYLTVVDAFPSLVLSCNL